MSAETNTTSDRRMHDNADQWDEVVAGTLPQSPVPPRPWQEAGYRPAQYLRAGLFLGALAGCTSLIVNVIGGVLWPVVSGQPQHPLRLIQVYLTFPLGESALQLNSGLLLALGCVLYLATGMLYGMLFEWVISYFVPYASTWARLAVCSVLALFVWLVNFYGLLSWLQPLLLGGRWILEVLPWWVAALTHLVFGWTMAVIYPLGDLRRPAAEVAS